jgi:hypothetical protein
LAPSLKRQRDQLKRGRKFDSETFAGLDRTARESGDGPRPKLAARIAVLREIVAAIPDNLPGQRDRALLLVGFAGAFRRSELARIAVEHIEDCEHGLRITLPVSKGDRAMKGVVVGIPHGSRRALPGARAAALAARGGHHRGAGVSAHLGDAAASQPGARLDADPGGRHPADRSRHRRPDLEGHQGRRRVRRGGAERPFRSSAAR